MCALLVASAAVAFWPGHHFALQDRDAIFAGASALRPAGTDALGRDRAVRCAVALLLALAGSALAALLATGIAAAVGVLAAMAPRWVAAAMMLVSDAFLTLPWIFLLMMVRSGLSLTASPLHSAAVTFGLLGLLGWPACARAVYRGSRTLLQGDAVTYGRACGLRGPQLMRTHLLPHLGPLLLPQFLVCVPAFIVAEANLGTLGLGVAEPLPSWGSMLLELSNSALLARSCWVYLPIALLVVVLLLLDAVTAPPRARVAQ
jgi:ABC-type dipeptide/oligopeptide/nickel transport system permease subunit